MKIYLTLVLIIFFWTANAQDAKTILQTSHEYCRKIQSGSYYMTKSMKNMTHTDTNSYSSLCYFKNVNGNGALTPFFHMRSFMKDTLVSESLFTGEELVNLNYKDSSGIIMSMQKWKDEIEYQLEDNNVFGLFMSPDQHPFPKEKDYSDKQTTFKILDEENINGKPTYHIQRHYKAGKLTPDNPILRYDVEYWIRKDDYVPVQYTMAIDMVMNNDTMYQFEKFTLHEEELNYVNESELQLNSIPTYFTLKDYVPYKQEELLKVGIQAPDWNLLSVNGDSMSLSDLKGKVVLLDFFYRHCYPCMLAIPSLVSLEKQYKDKGLTVLGINPIDKNDNDLKKFLKKGGVSYPVLMANKDLAKAYHVSGYPAFYLIDQNGIIIYANDGYSEALEKSLEKIIRKSL